MFVGYGCADVDGKRSGEEMERTYWGCVRCEESVRDMSSIVCCNAILGGKR